MIRLALLAAALALAALPAAAQIGPLSPSTALSNLQPPITLEEAYNACERHVRSYCDGGSCFTVCASRHGQPACTGDYAWEGCDKIADKWLASPERKTMLDEAAAAMRTADKRDKAIVDQFLKDHP